MKDKEYRELQLSSSLLIFIFLVIIILGVVIFILGVSVGKKQAVIVSQTTPSESIETITLEKPPPPEEGKDPINQEIASYQHPAKKEESPLPKKITRNLYYIQLGAFQDKSAANTLAEKYQNQGYICTVFDPLPTDRRQFYRVRIGGYETREQAEQEKAKLIQTEKKKPSDYFIVRH